MWKGNNSLTDVYVHKMVTNRVKSEDSTVCISRRETRNNLLIGEVMPQVGLGIHTSQQSTPAWVRACNDSSSVRPSVRSAFPLRVRVRVSIGMRTGPALNYLLRYSSRHLLYVSVTFTCCTYSALEWARLFSTPYIIPLIHHWRNPGSLFIDKWIVTSFMKMDSVPWWLI